MTQDQIDRLRSAPVQDYILAHEHEDIGAMLLRKSPFPELPSSLIADQIAGRRKAMEKIPTYYHTRGIIYPPSRNLEQSSSEQTARFKATLISELASPGSTLDLTGGLGIDSLFISRVSPRHVMVEPDADLLSIAAANHAACDAANITHLNTDAASFLNADQDIFSLTFIDPSRRDEHNRKVFTLHDCTPDVVKLRDTILQRSSYLLIKASPLLDIHQAIQQVSGISRVVVLSVGNECKELLLLVDRDFTAHPVIYAVVLEKAGEVVFSFTAQEEKQADVKYATPRAYLYEPNASILKAGAFKLVGERFGLAKLNINTHYYTSDVCAADFPGRVFRIIAEVKADAKSVGTFLPEGKANITTRNYPMSPAALKAKLKIDDGGDQYIIAFTGPQRRHVVVAERVR